MFEHFLKNFETIEFFFISKNRKNAKDLRCLIFIAKYGHNGFVPNDRNVQFR